jgi:Concanavalin A-like lectin/glucanases superfamily
MKYFPIFFFCLLAQLAVAQTCITPTFTQIPAVCEGENVDYLLLPPTSNNGATGQWSPATINNTATTTYTFTPMSSMPGMPCYTTTTMTITVRTPVTPRFTLPVICEGAAYTLPTTSDEGITGTWFPAYNSAMPAQMYTFSPTESSCINETMLMVITTPITTEPTPIFTQIEPICSGTSFTLPTTSNNGISGTWTPAIDNTTTTTYRFTSNPQQCVIPSLGEQMTVTVNPRTGNLTTISTCENTYTWPINNITYDVSGSYTHTNGCNTDALILRINNTAATALSFDGIDDDLQISHNSSLNMTQFTIETWVKWERSGNSIDFICSKDFESMEIHTGGALGNNIRFIPTNGVWLDGGVNTITPNTWIHLACVYNPSIGLAKMYINGEEIPLTNNGVNPLTTPVVSSTRDMIIGNRNIGGIYPLVGQLDEFRVWNRALSQAEIQNRYSCEVPTTDCGLVVNLHFNQGLANGINTSITSVTDASGNNNHATLNKFDKSCGNSVSNFIYAGMGGFTCTNNTILPTFSALPSIFSGTITSPLPTISNNGITGTWTPAFNNLVTTTYSFTPTAGLCSNVETTNLTLTVIPCPTTQTFTSSSDNISSGTNLQKANQVITATNKITGGNTTYQAGNKIEMNPGFEVSGGAIYLTKILAGCN